MKRLLLFTITLLFGVSLLAQQNPLRISKSIHPKMAVHPGAIDNVTTFTQPVNVVANSKSTLDDVIGGSKYDMQSNASMMSRLYLWPDGTLAGTWTRGVDEGSGYADRGSAYNYNNGSSWGPAPDARIETMKCGWPNINPWMGTGESNISHNATSSLVLNTRPVKGTGAWTQTLPLTVPTGINDLVWPRSISNGNNFQNLHIITVGRGNSGGQTQPLLYYRSLDGGAIWDKMGVVLPQLDATNFKSMGGDGYAWIEPHGDTIAFVAGDGSTDTFLMYSYDNGNNWTKEIIMPNAYRLNAPGTATIDYIGADGCIAGVMDKTGVFHVAFGRMTWANTGNNYYPGTDGLIYWNSTMPALDTLIVADLDSCMEHGILLGYVVDGPGPGDTIVGFPTYGVSVSSFPQLTVDDNNNIYFLWQGLTAGNPSPDDLNFCHIWGRAWYHDQPQWTEMMDLNTDISYYGQEFAYPAMAKRMKNDNLQLITQTSSTPGSNIKDTSVPVHDVDIAYRQVPGSTFWPVGIDDKAGINKNPVSQNRPNPVKDITYFSVNPDKASAMTIEVTNIMGQKVMSMDKGTVTTGTQIFSLDCSKLSSGIYFYTVTLNGESYTHRMIVE